MATITRKDGQQFVIQAYRDVLAQRKRSLLTQALRTLAQSQGQYVHLTKNDSNQLDVVLSHDVGYLLGESIWCALSKPRNLIYCEAMPGGHQVLLVVVRQNHVFIDTQISNHQLESELAPLLSERLAYQVVVSGDVPLSQTTKPGHFLLPKDLVAGFKKLNRGLFADLPLDSALQLKPLNLALRSEKLGRKPKLLLGTLLLALLAVGGGWFWVGSQPAKSVDIVKKSASHVVSAYESALLTPAPAAQLNELHSLVEGLYQMPGWQMSHIDFDGHQYRFKLHSGGAGIAALERWAQAQNLALKLTANGIWLLQPSSIKNRKQVQVLQPLQPLLAMVIDEVDQLLHTKAISMGMQQQQGGAVMTTLTINVSQISPEIVDIMGRELDHLPLSLKAINMDVESGLLSGTIQLSVWGLS